MPDSARARGRGILSLVLLLFAARSEGGPAVGAAPSLDMGQALQNERMIRRALGIDPFLPGSLGDVIDASLYPRPHRLARHRGNEKMMKTTVANTQKKGGGRSSRGRYVPASSAASRHHVRTPSNVLAVEHTSGVFLMVASFQTDYVFKYNLGEGLGHPEVFASHVSCDLVVQSACTELSGPWGMATHGNEFFVRTSRRKRMRRSSEPTR